MRAGAAILPAGRRIGPGEIGAAAAAGAGVVTVRARPRIALIVTGNETAPSGASLGHGAVWDVNSPMLVAAIEGSGATLAAAETCPDAPRAIAAAVRRAAASADLVVTTGGVSVGDADHVHAAIREAGGVLALAGVAMKPGKPASLGRIGDAVWLGAPGNPVAALVAWVVFGRPILRALSGEVAGPDSLEQVVPTERLTHRGGRCEFRPARLDGVDALGRRRARVAASAASARLSPLACADGFVRLPAGRPCVEAGVPLDFHPIACP
jgi:molybdopterin molybdotransferase